MDAFCYHNETISVRESRHALRWVTTVDGEKFAFLIGSGYGGRTVVVGVVKPSVVDTYFIVIGLISECCGDAWILFSFEKHIFIARLQLASYW